MATPIPAAVRRNRDRLEGAEAPANLADNLVPIRPDVPAGAVQQDAAPAIAQALPVDLENDAFLQSFMADAQPAAPAPSAAPAPTPVSPTAGAPAAPVPAFSFESLFADGEPSAAPAVNPDSAVTQELAALRELVAGMAQQQAKPAQAPQFQAPAHAPQQAQPFQATGYTLTDEQRTAYSESIPVIEQVAAVIANRQTAAIMDEVVALRAELASRASDFDSRLSGFRGQTYKSQLYAAIPDIDALVSTQAFQQFIAQNIPYSGETVRARLGAAHKSHDLMTVSAIMQDFRRFSGESGTGQPAMGAPVPSAAPAAPVDASAPAAPAAKLPFSRMKDATRLRNAGRMTSEEYNKVKALFEKAELEQRIDYNA